MSAELISIIMNQNVVIYGQWSSLESWITRYNGIDAASAAVLQQGKLSLQHDHQVKTSFMRNSYFFIFPKYLNQS